MAFPPPRRLTTAAPQHLACVLAVAGLSFACGSDSAPATPDPEPHAGVDAGGVPLPGDAGPSPVASARPLVCGPDGWCWDNPAGPQGNSLLALAARSASDAWAVGEHGVALQFDGESWVSRWAPTAESLRAVFVGASEVWAVGDGSTVLRHDGQAWSVVSVPGLPAELSLRGVAVRGSDVWIVGDDASLFERRGGSWQAVVVDGFSDSLRAVWAGDDAVWAVGNAGSVLRLDAGEWARVSSGTGRDLLAVHGHGDDVWYAGAQGEIRYWNPEEERFERPVGEGAPRFDLTALQVAADGSVRVTGSSGVIDFWDAGATCAVEGDAGAPPEPCPGWGDARLSGQSVALRGLWASGDQLLAVGDQGAIVRFDAATRRVESPASADNFLAVAGAGSSVWVAGDRLLRREGNRWRELQRDSPRALYAVQPLADRLLVAGTGGVVRRYAGDEWEAMDVRADAWLRGLWCDGQTGWLVGSRGYAWGLLNQSLWTELSTPTDRDLLDVWATASGVAWAVGADGVILRHDGRGWAAIPSGPDGGVRVDLRAVWGADDDLWAVGTGGTILHFDGTLWARASDEAPFSLNGVWGRSPSEVWAVGSGGVILRYDGSSWVEERSGTGYALNDVWGDGSRLWAVGERGTILVKTLD